MEKQEFIKQVEDNIEKWADDERKDEHKKLISYCYDIACADKGLIVLSKDAIEDTCKTMNKKDKELSDLKDRNFKQLCEITRLKKLIQAQAELIAEVMK